MDPNSFLVNFVYLISAVLFIVGMKGLTHPRTAVRGNLLSAIGMLLAILATVIVRGVNLWVVFAAVIVGSTIGWIWSIRVAMTGMPQLVALFNGFGGGASMFVAWAALIIGSASTTQSAIATAISALVGSVTLLGSLIAWGKLEEKAIFNKPFNPPALQLINAGLLLACIVVSGFMVVAAAQGSITTASVLFGVLVLLSAALGVLLVMPIGGADMPVVIALLNSYSGLAAAATGFVLDNYMLIVAGSLVGASGVILTAIMCRAMNRSLVNVIFGRIDASTAASADDVYAGKVKSTSAEEVAMLLESAQRVVVVPGYGMAVAQAQHAVRDLYRLLESRGVDVLFAIHPVAGRMPGHMNVLLAEADIPYDRLKEMDEINPMFDQIDVVIVNGANDVVNPDARTNPASPIAGMPVLNVDLAKTCVVIKRSLAPGFAKIPNPLFAADNCLMLFGDGKKATDDIVAALKA